MGLNTKTYWLTDRQSQCDFDFDFEFDSSSSVQQSRAESRQNWVSPGQSRKNGSAEGLLWVTVIYCDYEWLYKEWPTNPITNPTPVLLVTPINRDNIMTSWAHLDGLLYKSLFVCMCIPTIVTRQRLAKHIPSATKNCWKHRFLCDSRRIKGN
jgi:hypothetical protein